jgi:iron(III) transport system permease protein
MAAASCLLSLFIGGGLAFLRARTDIPGKGFVYTAALAPLVLPSYVSAFAWSILAAPKSGLLNTVLRDIGLPPIFNVFTMPGLIFVTAICYAPYAFLLLNSAMMLLNSDLEEAGVVHGGSTARVIRSVTLPLVTPAILGSALLIFTLSVENFPIAQIIGNSAKIETLPTLIYRLMNSPLGREGEAAAVAITLTCGVLVLTGLQISVVSRGRFTTVTGKGTKNNAIKLGRAQWIARPAIWLYFLCSTVLPFAAIAIIAFKTSPYTFSTADFLKSNAFSLKWFHEALGSTAIRLAASNTAIVSLLVGVIGVLFCFFLVAVRYRTKLPFRNVMEFISMAPVGIPAMVFGLGLFWTWLVMPIPIYGTLAVIVVAFVAQLTPQGFRGIAASYLQIDRDLEDSAVQLGASRLRSNLYVTMPLLRNGIVATFFLLLVLSMRELSVALFLFTSNTRLLSIAIFDDIDTAITSRAAAVSLMYSLVILIFTVISRRTSVSGQA